MRNKSNFKIHVMSFVLLLSVTLFAQVQSSLLGNVNVNGFISQGYMHSSANNFLGQTSEGTFEFNEFGINFSKQITDDLRVGIQFFARDLGYLDNDKIVVDWAYGDYRYEDWLGIRVGKIRMPLGLYNEYRDLDLARTNIFMPQGVYNETWRSTFNAIKGLGVYGTVEAGPLGIFNYQAQVGALSVNSDDGLNKYLEDQLFAHFNTYHLKTTYIANLSWETPLTGLKLAGSLFYMDGLSTEGVAEDSEFWRGQSIGAATGIAALAGLPSPTNYQEAQQIFALSGFNLDLVNRQLIQNFKDIKGLWYSGEFTWDDLILSAEYFYLSTKLEAVSPGYGSQIDPGLEVLRPISDNELAGYYGSVGYQLTDVLAASVYYSEYFPDINDKKGGFQKSLGLPGSNAWLKDTAFSVKYDLNANWIVKAEAHLMDGTAVMYRLDQEDPTDVDKNWSLFAAKITYNF